jgi:tRNA pseudouridine55 synthase
MEKSIHVWKPIGVTPLEAVKKFKQKYPEYENEIISYAGRLDPMAEGVLVLLIGEENKNRNKYLDFDKEYETELVFGLSTDTFDSLGLVLEVKTEEINQKDITENLYKFLGKQKQAYPPYSSKTVNGKPLFWWARQNKINKIIIPSHDIEIYSIRLVNLNKISVEKLADSILKKVKSMEGDFRQKEIIKTWEKIKIEFKNEEFIKAKIKISCSTGTYIRRMASDLGIRLGTGAFALSIKRIRVGEFEEKDCIKF